MPKNYTQINIFLSSPSDVQTERDILDNVINDINGPLLATHGVSLNVLRWERNVRPSFGPDPQAVVNDQIGDEYDVFLGILWSRFGTETPRAASGTKEEFDRALERLRSGDRNLEIMIYFKTKPLSITDIDASQLKLLQDFKRSLPEMGGFYSEFRDEQAFEESLRTHLISLAKKFSPNNDTVASVQNDSGLISELEENDLGYLDYLDMFNSSMSDCTEAIGKISTGTEKIGEDFQARTRESQAFLGGSENSNHREVRNLIKRCSEDLNSYGKMLEEQLPIFSDCHAVASEALSNVLVLASEFGHDESEYLPKLHEDIRGQMEAMEYALDSLDGLRKSIAELPRMTSDLNRAKRYTVKNLDSVHEELKTGISTTNNVSRSIRSMIANNS